MQTNPSHSVRNERNHPTGGLLKNKNNIVYDVEKKKGNSQVTSDIHVPSVLTKSPFAISVSQESNKSNGKMKLSVNAKTDRQMLVDMLEQMVTNSSEYKVLQDYKKHIVLSLKEKVERLSEEIKRVSFAEALQTWSCG